MDKQARRQAQLIGGFSTIGDQVTTVDTTQRNASELDSNQLAFPVWLCHNCAAFVALKYTRFAFCVRVNVIFDCWRNI